jgi:hypothetical protein
MGACSSRRLTPPDIRRHRLVGERLERRIERHHFLLLLVEQADRDQALDRLFLACERPEVRRRARS